MQTDTNSMIILDSIDSTNNYAMGLLRTNSAANGLAIFAQEQTAGKGRRGKAWKSNKNENIMMSIIADAHHLSINHQFKISAAAALATFDLFNFYRLNQKIKWPNDIFLNDRKAAGILIENVIKGHVWQWSVIGIGVNVNQTEFEGADYNPTSLRQITNQTYNVIELAAQLRLNVIERYRQLKEGNFGRMINEYNKNLFRLNEKVKLKKGNIVFETVIKGVTEQGELITFDTMERKFGFDEVQWVL